MKSIDRTQFIAEELIRGHIRGRIQNKLDEQKKNENLVRNFIRKILKETEAGTEEPSQYTGINVLADLLEKIIPVLEDDYKMLTTSDEQRESFRNHIVHAIKNALTPIDIVKSIEDLPENFSFEIDKEFLLEKIKIDLDSTNDDPADNIEGEFIDIAAPEEDGFVHLDDQNETGRNFAATTFKQVEKQIVDAYDMLADEEDKKLFYDYLITNILLYFDKFEDELTTELPDTTTPEYESNKDNSTADAEGTEGEGGDTESTETEPEEPSEDPFANI